MNLRQACVVGAVVAAGCTDPRARPVPPIVDVTFPSTQLTSPDTLLGSLYAYDDDGLERFEIALVGPDSVIRDSIILLDGSIELNRVVFWLVPSGVPSGAQLVYRVQAFDFAGFATTDSTLFTVQ